MRASEVSPPAACTALPIAEICSMPVLLGITYDYCKALPNKFRHCLISPMNNQGHMGEKLKEEAERLGLKPAQVAKVFDVKPPSVYDWYEHGRIHKKHYPTLVEWSGKPLSWWLDIPIDSARVAEEPTAYGTKDHRHDILIQLFDGLPSKEQDDLIRTLTEKKQHYDAVVNELLLRRNAA